MAQTQNTKKNVLFDNEIKERNLSEETKNFLLSLPEKEKIEILNGALIANSISASTPQNSFFLYLLFNSKISKKQKDLVFNRMKRVYEFYNSLGAIDKQIFKHGILNRFKTNNPTIEYWDFKKKGSNIENFGDIYKEINKRQKYIGMQTFVELFGMIYSRVQRLLNNGNFFRKNF